MDGPTFPLSVSYLSLKLLLQEGQFFTRRKPPAPPKKNNKALLELWNMSVEHTKKTAYEKTAYEMLQILTISLIKSREGLMSLCLGSKFSVGKGRQTSKLYGE